MVICACDCGNFVYVPKSKIRLNRTRSCGCLNHEKFINLGNRRRLDSNNAAINALISNYKGHVGIRGLTYNLTRDQFIEITSGDCHYCGAAPSRVSKPRSGGKEYYVFNGIDRVDNSRGYEPDNVVPCCYTCNIIKSNLSVDELSDHIEKILRNLKNAKQV